MKPKFCRCTLFFCSDLNRDTLPGGDCEKMHTTRANTLLSSPVMHMPHTICKEFVLTGGLNGLETEILHIKNNRKRTYHIELNQKFESLTLKPLSVWGGGDKLPVISFDFE